MLFFSLSNKVFGLQLHRHHDDLFVLLFVGVKFLSWHRPLLVETVEHVKCLLNCVLIRLK